MNKTLRWLWSQFRWHLKHMNGPATAWHYSQCIHYRERINEENARGARQAQDQ